MRKSSRNSMTTIFYLFWIFCTMHVWSTLCCASKRFLKDTTRIVAESFGATACITTIISNKKYLCSCNKSPTMLSNSIYSVFSSTTLCALSEYEIYFDFPLEFVSSTSLFRRNGRKEVGHLTVFEPIIYIYQTSSNAIRNQYFYL